MKLEIVRYDLNPQRSIGKLSIDGVYFCYTLEDAVRNVKVAGETAIPAGHYSVILNQSTRFKRLMPLIPNVPEFTGIRIHPGNTEADTSGCVLVGFTRSTDCIWDSRRAFDSLMGRLEAVAGRELISLTISEERQEGHYFANGAI